jgi:hypothetical protein
MDVNLPIPAEAAELTVTGHNGTARVDGYEWAAVRMITAELRRFAETIAHLGPLLAAPDDPDYEQAQLDDRDAIVNLLRSRAEVLDAVTDPDHPERDPAAERDEHGLA